jgi:hypothetical protein
VVGHLFSVSVIFHGSSSSPAIEHNTSPCPWKLRCPIEYVKESPLKGPHFERTENETE